MSKSTPYALRDWTNRLIYPVGHAQGYTREQFEARKGHDFYLLGAPAVFQDAASYARAREMAGDAPIYAYVHVLHTYSDHVYNTTWSHFRNAEGIVMRGTALLNAASEPSCRWRGEDRAFDLYNTDPDKLDAEEWAAVIAQWVEWFPVEGLFLDYLSTEPYVYPDDPPVEAPRWRDWQAQALFHLRKRRPNTKLLANGPWAVREPLWTQNGMLDGVFLERMGTLWGTLEQGMADLRAHTGLKVMDAVTLSTAQAVSAATGWTWSENWRHR